MSGAYYHFLSAVRLGLAAAIDSPAQGARATLPIRVHVRLRRQGSFELIEPEPVRREVELFGPGDAVGFDQRVIARTDPRPGTSTFEPNCFPAVEFTDIDFAWRLSPERGGDRGVRPWIVLVVLRAGDGGEREFEDLSPDPGRVPSIRVRQDRLPDLAQSWRWAHVQALTGADSLSAAELEELQRTAPERCVCRLLCPRRLVPGASYTTFIVPGFELGRLAGLDRLASMPGIQATAPAWDARSPDPIELPTYHRWEFRTSPRGDFEHLVRRLVPRALEELGLRDMDCAAPGFGLRVERPDVDDERGRHILQREGALQSVGARYTPWGRDRGAGESEPFQRELAGLLARAGAGEPELEDMFPLDGTPLTELAFSLLEDGETLRVVWRTAAPAAGRLEYRLAGGADEPVAAPAESSDGGRLHTAGAALIPERTYAFRIVVSAAGAGEVSTPEARVLLPLPVVVPPIYGRWHAARAEVVPGAPGWLDTLNLDPRHRAAAGEGAEVVRREQEPLLASAWEQLGAVEAANDLLRRAKLGRQISGWLHGRIDSLGLDAFLRVTEPVHRRTVVDGAARTVAAGLHETTGVRRTAIEPAFRRIARPRGPIRRRQGVRPGPEAMLARMASGEVRAAGPHPVPRGTPSITGVTRRLFGRHLGGPGAPLPPDAARFTDAAMARGLVRSAVPFALSDLVTVEEQDRVVERMPELVPPPAAAQQFPGAGPLTELRAALARELRPSSTIVDRIRSRLRVTARLGRSRAAAAADPLDEIMAHPEFPQAMYEPLRAISPQLILPGVETVPQNTVAVVKTNRRFIEAYMAGLNHELAGELLWRRYPTDQRGTFFRQFWDAGEHVPGAGEVDGRGALLDDVRARLADIRPLHRWGDAPLGANAAREEDLADNLVLLLRGDLIARYPGAVIYAVGARRSGGRLIPLLAEYGEAGEVHHPLFRGSLGDDLVFLGFPFAEARSSAGSPGKFFVIEERVGEARFGLDEAAGAGLSPPAGEVHLDRWDQLGWQHTSLAGPEHAGAYLDAFDGTITCAGPGPARWSPDSTSAERAWITLKRPARILIHADQLIPAAAGRGRG